jgi:hypothetical protein
MKTFTRHKVYSAVRYVSLISAVRQGVPSSLVSSTELDSGEVKNYILNSASKYSGKVDEAMIHLNLYCLYRLQVTKTSSFV